MKLREICAGLCLAAGSVVAAEPPVCEPPRRDMGDVAAKATQWAEQRSWDVLLAGTKLSEERLALAREVGVKEPGRIRVLLAGKIQLSEDPHLKAAGASVGLSPSTADGLTLGYAVVLRKGAEDDLELLRHEFRHVAQYEACGGIEPFLKAHIGHLVERGYRDSPFEVDARAHERSRR